MSGEDELPGVPGYKLLSRLGSGGMAHVYLAIQEGIDRRVALKFLSVDRTDPAAYEQFKTRFYREARTIGNLNHPGITTVHQFGEHEGRLFLAMEYLAGGDLADRIRAGVVAPDECIRWVREIAEALAQAHEAGVVHRDIKPENLLFDEQGRIKLADFGIARRAEDDSSLTKGFVIGTLPYMSPEQMLGSESVDARADLYSLGALFFEMLTGKQAFPQKQVEAVYLAKLNEPVKLPAELARYQPLLDKLLAAQPEARFGDARAFIAELDKLSKPEVAESGRFGVSMVVVAIAAVGLLLTVYRLWFTGPEGSDAYQLKLSVLPEDSSIYLLPELQVLDRRSRLPAGAYEALAWAPAHQARRVRFELPGADDDEAVLLQPVRLPLVEEYHRYLDVAADADAERAEAFLSAYPDSPLRDLVRVLARDEGLDIELLEKKAQVGDLSALVTLSEILDQGWADLAADRQRSMSLARRAADSGYAFAQYHYAIQLLEQGDRVREGTEVLEAAAAQGFFPAQNLLGAGLVEGQWIGQDLERGEALLRSAAAQGYREAMYNLSVLLSMGGAERRAEAASMVRRAAELNDPMARSYLDGG